VKGTWCGFTSAAAAELSQYALLDSNDEDEDTEEEEVCLSATDKNREEIIISIII